MAAGSTAAAARRPGVAGTPRAHLSLTSEETALLLRLQSAPRSLRRGQEIISEGRRCTTLFILTEGIAIRYRILRDGQRQILDLLLPGDFAGLRSCFFESALYSVKTLTKSQVTVIPVARLLGLFDTHPLLAAKLFWASSCESAICAEHLIAVGRRSALERVSHFLLELLTRLQFVGLADERSFRLPLTQEVIGDVLGLSIPYVNRVLHQLRDSGLVRISEQRVAIENIEELSALADFEHTYLKPLSINQLLAENA
jgi:CRP-like cAMP-binding protein